ncbi:MAG TPA: 2-oxo acid dehydrogenase subunit E2 [Thermotogota bacterium]|nr:2-oxo acid dehydrogenase subunit E2 [Thermotogota bacterium]HRW92226.1 2-oxo acid dehydrogenase subunit E2 [Thermotogota bacterium]
MFKRKDGVIVRNLPEWKRFVPFLMPTKSDALIFFRKTIFVEKTLAYLHAKNQPAQGKRVSLFSILVCALLHTGVHFPDLNRFIVGKRTYQRNGWFLSYTAKSSLEKDGETVLVKAAFGDHDRLEDVFQKLEDVKQKVRHKAASQTSGASSELAFFFSFPPFLRPAVFGFLKLLNLWNILPYRMIEGDPFFSSCYMANVGSIGLEPPYHHLFEWGTASLFLSVGKIHPVPVRDENGNAIFRDALDIHFTLDERVSEGVYLARALEYFQQMVENPSLME